MNARKIKSPDFKNQKPLGSGDFKNMVADREALGYFSCKILEPIRNQTSASSK